MDIELIRSCAALGESDTLEFKKSTAEKERACRTLCAFANGRGGKVLLVAPLSGKRQPSWWKHVGLPRRKG